MVGQRKDALERCVFGRGVHWRRGRASDGTGGAGRSGGWARLDSVCRCTGRRACSSVAATRTCTRTHAALAFAAQGFNQVGDQQAQLAGGNRHIGVKTTVVLAAFALAFGDGVQQRQLLDLQTLAQQK